MSILIKGLERPKNCMSCPFPVVGIDAYYCHCPTQDGKEYDFKFAETIPDGCPLVEVPTPHGDLIDRDVVAEKIRQRLGIRNLDYLLETEKPIAMSIKEAPTVIESEE